MEAPDRNLGLDLVRVTEAAALSSSRWLGRGDKNAGDQAAVDAMRLSFNTLPIEGMIIIGEGEKDEAPMLYNGERVGSGSGHAVDVAVDPVEGTNLLAYGRPNAISVVGIAPRGSMFNPGPSYYMQKLVVPAEAKDVADLDAPVGDNLKKNRPGPRQGRGRSGRLRPRQAAPRLAHQGHPRRRGPHPAPYRRRRGRLAHGR